MYTSGEWKREREREDLEEAGIAILPLPRGGATRGSNRVLFSRVNKMF